MRGKVSRVILVCTLLIVFTNAGWWPFEKKDDKPKRNRRRGGEPDDDEPARVEQEWEVPEDERVANKEKGQKDPRSAAKEERDSKRRDKIASAGPKSKKPKNREEMVDKKQVKEVLADASLEETETFEDDGYLSDDEIHRLWTEHMHDFVPEDMMNVIVEKNSVESLYEYIGHEKPTTIKGAYYVYGGSKEKSISCIVYDPNRQILYKRVGSPQGILIFDTTEPGEYSVIFSNFQSGQDIIVTLALHTYEDKEEHPEYDLTEDGQRITRGEDQQTDSNPFATDNRSEEEMAASDDDVGNVRAMIRDIQVKSKQIQSEAKLSLMRQSGHNEDLLSSASYNFYASILELMAFGGILAFQTSHIKKCLDNKLIL